ncbi:MAG: hypothetical protein R2715_03295 [Ilumatobacteraceae bacterium]
MPGRPRPLDTGARPMAAGHAILASAIALVLVVAASGIGLLDREGGGGDASSFDFGAATTVEGSSTDVTADSSASDGSTTVAPAGTDPAQTSTTAAATTTTDGAPQVPTAQNPAKVYVAGDSDAGNLGPPLQGILEDTGVVTSSSSTRSRPG